MALSGIGGKGTGGSPLDQFQKLRDAAQKKLESSDRQAGLADLIQRKQKQLGTGAASPEAARSAAERIPPASAAPGSGGTAPGATVKQTAAYGRSGNARPQDAAPRLGRYVDFLA